MKKSHTAKDVAEFMARELEENEILYQEQIVYEIEEAFGSEFVYLNENGNPAIDRAVLTEFRELTPNAVWDRREKCWRQRYEFDMPGRAQE